MSPRRPAAALLAAATAVALVLAGCTGARTDAPAPTPSRSADPVPRAAPGVGVQLFQWTWDAIARECTEFLGPAGYAWVLTSPPQEHVLGEPWWTAYQPVSYRLESRLGTREQFAAMVAACREAGVAVVADAVVNHMTGQDEPGVGWAGTPYEHYEYPGTWSDAEGHFHHCDLTPQDDIASYAVAAQVQRCELLNLADLATGTEPVRARLREYLADLVDLGVAGVRVDAAKHMPAEDVGAIVSGLPEGSLVLQEVIGASGEPIQPRDYLGNGAVFDFTYGRDLVGYVGGGSVARVLQIGSGESSLPSEQAVVFVENHDTERNGSTFLYKDGDNYVLATVMMLAGEYGAPVVYSGYAFRQRDTGPVQDADGAVVDAACGQDIGPTSRYDVGEWVCQHRWTAVAGMVGWRRAVADAPVGDVWEGRRAVAFSRGDRGFVAVNAGAVDLAETVPTALPAGRYCDVVGGALVDGACTGVEVVVSDEGTVDVALAGDTALAIHVDARPAG